MRATAPSEIELAVVHGVGLDPTLFDLSTPEVLAALLRRSAGFHCPCSPRTLVEAVVQPMRGLATESGLFRQSIEEMLELLVAYGDILESSRIGSDEDNSGRRLLYAAPPSFLTRASGSVLLIGIAPEHNSALPDELEAKVDYVNHTRRLLGEPDEELPIILKELGLIELSWEHWMEAPLDETAPELLSRLDSLLEVASPSGEVPGLSVLDSEQPVRYYRGRWVEKPSRSGRFVGRRPQAYGADLWCYVELDEGHPIRLVDLPVRSGVARGCDDAWHLQAAIDANRGSPQEFRIREGTGRSRVLDLFSPIPQWASRRWDSMGEPIPASRCLMSYSFDLDELDEEIRFARDRLFLEHVG